ncbi:hypothetical protein C815_01802 [Firmicutes bacterium M10-2]|nr:hypothetical protein C815_01802 [Firmicutes bacterium M10-2]
MKTQHDLIKVCERIQGRGYPAYKDCRGEYICEGGYVLSIDHVQGDPFAAPSDVSIRVKNTFEKSSYETDYRRIALEDTLLRIFYETIKNDPYKGKGSGKSGTIYLSRPQQEILERSACHIDEKEITIRMHIGFPANGRRVLSNELVKILFDYLPEKILNSLIADNLSTKNLERVHRALSLADDQHAVREEMKKRGLVAFIANDSILPRKSGVSQLPMLNAIPFLSPESLSVEIPVPHRKKIAGMGIKKGITLIIGGGYHGKSTLLEGLERGVYNHISGDGREFVLCDSSAVKSRAEDGRSIENDNIEAFINHLPNHKKTNAFSSEDASGSTSQAAGVCEALEADSKVLLFDEDTSAANFMVRDPLMQMVVHPNQEPITPLVYRIRQLYEQEDVSTILVAGSSGAFFEQADLIIQMARYIPMDVTSRAKEMALAYPDLCSPERKLDHKPFYTDRIPLPNKFLMGERIKIKTQGLDAILLDREPLDVRLVEQLIDPEQLTTLGAMVLYAHKYLMDGKKDLSQIADELELLINKKGLRILGNRDFCRVRKQEFMAVINRYRSQKMKQKII